MPVKIFIHGLESSNKGTKSVYFNERYADIIVPTFTGNLPERMDKLNSILSDASEITLVGSSFGGLMATLFAMENEDKISRMVLLAPALNLMEHIPEKNRTISVPAWIFHGSHDDVIPLEKVREAAPLIFKNLTFEVVEDDHFLHNTFKKIDWDGFLL